VTIETAAVFRNIIAMFTFCHTYKHLLNNYRRFVLYFNVHVLCFSPRFPAFDIQRRRRRRHHRADVSVRMRVGVCTSRWRVGGWVGGFGGLAGRWVSGKVSFQ